MSSSFIRLKIISGLSLVLLKRRDLFSLFGALFFCILLCIAPLIYGLLDQETQLKTKLTTKRISAPQKLFLHSKGQGSENLSFVTAAQINFLKLLLMLHWQYSCRKSFLANSLTLSCCAVQVLRLSWRVSSWNHVWHHQSLFCPCGFPLVSVLRWTVSHGTLLDLGETLVCAVCEALL